MHRSVRINLHPLSYKISVTVCNGYIIISCTRNRRKLGDFRFKGMEWKLLLHIRTYRVYLKYLDKLQVWVRSSFQNKEKSSNKHTSRNERFSSLIERLNSTINTITMQYYDDNQHNISMNNSPNLTTVELLLFARHHSKNILKTPTSLNARMDTSDHGLLHPFKSPGAVANGFDRHKNAFVKSLFILNCSWIHLGFKCHTDKNVKGWGLANVGSGLENCGYIFVWICLFFFGRKIQAF